MYLLKKYKKLHGYLFIFPSVMGFSVLYLFPFIDAIRYSLLKSSFDKTFVGLYNYKKVLESEAFILALKNTGFFMGISIPVLILLSLAIALLIYEIKAPKLIKFLIVLPIAIPSASVVGFFRKFLNTGLINILDSEYAMLGVILIFIWKNTGYNLVIFLAGLTQLDKSAIEAAQIDGANYIERLRFVILPLLTPTTVFVGIVTIINSFKVFKDVFILQGCYPNPHIYMLQHYMNNKFNNLQYEELTAAASVFAFVIFIFAFLLFILDRRHSKMVGDN